MWDFRSIYFNKFFLYFIKHVSCFSGTFIICTWSSYGFPRWPLDIQIGIFNSLVLPSATFSKFKNLLVPFQCNNFSLSIFVVDCFVIPWEKLIGHAFSFLFFVNIHHCAINNLSAAFLQQHTVVTQNQLKNICVFHGSLSHSLLLWHLSSVSIYTVIMLLPWTFSPKAIISHWCPFCTIHFTKWIHYVLGEGHFSNEWQGRILKETKSFCCFVVNGSCQICPSVIVHLILVLL